MAWLFILATGAIASVFFGKRGLSIALLLITLILGCEMLWYHATDHLKIVL